MWIATTPRQHRRDGLRFASDLTDAEWAVIEPLLPRRAAVGRPPRRRMREIVDAIFYVLRGGIPRRSALLSGPTDRQWLVCRLAR